MGLVKPEQLNRTPGQLQRTVQRLAANPIITVGRPSMQSEPVRPRSSVFSMMAASNTSEPAAKKPSGFDRLEAFFVQKFREVTQPETAKVPKSPA